MAVLTTPTTQTVHGSVVDQSAFQSAGQYTNTSPSTYLTRMLARMMSAAHSSNTVLQGLNVISVTGQNTNILNFTLSPGSVVIDSNIIHFPNNTTISTDAIPNTAPSKLRVGIFASYTFNAGTAASAANNVIFTSYIYDMNDNMIAPTIWGGGEKILLVAYNIDMSGPQLAPTMHVPNWTRLGTAATLSGVNAQLSVTNTQPYAASAHIATSIPSGTVCDFTADVVSGNARLRVGNTGANSLELLDMSSSVAATVTNQFTTTSNGQTISLGNVLSTANNTSTFDNVQIEYPSTSNLLVGDNSNFATSIGNWLPSANNSAYWDGIGSIVILPADNASKNFVIGTDIQPNTIYALSSTSATNASVSVGTTGVLSSDVLVTSPIANNTRIMFTTPASGTITVTLHGTGNVNNMVLGDISIEESLINGDSSTFATTVGTWVASAATISSVTGRLNVLDTSALANTGNANITVNVVSGKTYTMNVTVNALSALAYYYVSGSVAAPITATLTAGTSTVTIVASATGQINIQLGSANASTTSIFDNVVLLDNLNASMLPGDNSSFAASIGSWIPSVYSAASGVNGLTLTNPISMTTGSENSVTQTISLTPNSNYQFELTSPASGTFEILDGATIISSASIGGIVKFTTTAATSYVLRFYNPVLTVNAQATIGNINLFPRIKALSDADSTFTSISGWGISNFGNISDIGNGLKLRNVLGFGAEVSIAIPNLVVGNIYRLQYQGSPLAQSLVAGVIIGIGVVDATFTATATSETLVLKVNSIVIGDEATFRAVSIFEDNTHTARVTLPANTRSSGGNLKALSVNNPSGTMRTEISVAGHGVFKVKGDDPITRAAETYMINALDASTASWILDIPKMKPTATSLAYGITGILL